MTMFPAPNVLILAQNPQKSLDWADWLRDGTAQVWSSPAGIPAESRPAVIVTDLPSRADVAARLSEAPNSETAQQFSAASIAIVGIDAADWGNVHLPGDVAAGELVLACRLLAEIMRLRTEQARAAIVQRDTAKLAQTDPLTGLPNRRAWDDQLASRHGEFEATGHPLWLALIDLDEFKQVNVAGGLAAGDQSLRRVAQAMSAAVRRDDLLARLGGDEFGLLLVGVDESVARGIFERLRATIAEQDSAGTARLTASIGYAPAALDSPDPAKLFDAAERALRKAKQAGGNRAMRGVPKHS
jgi:diguanylate cyclase (GGDEF)-like protein